MEEMALSGNEREGNRLPTFNQRRIQSEVRVPGGQEESRSAALQRKDRGKAALAFQRALFPRRSQKEKEDRGTRRRAQALKRGGREQRMSSEGADKAGVIQARVKAHIQLLARRGAAENRITGAEGRCLPKGGGNDILRALVRSRIRFGGSSSRFHTLLSRPG
uniref:Uncharacterized protein n=1 Tax=Fagus sylvatica TaxID=28930 RepID=A0A2N9EA50_FAGSY